MAVTSSYKNNNLIFQKIIKNSKMELKNQTIGNLENSYYLRSKIV